MEPHLHMRASQILITTLKETPADIEVVSHQLMLRAGLIRQLASGLYTWLPMGLRILRKAEGIVREEMNLACAQELLMPSIQPSELWQESNRWKQYGPELLRMTDRHNREFCYGPTHEEVITDLVRQEIRSHKQLPINFYQVQTKFRDEIRPHSGVIRAREFLMKDAYSFHLSYASLQQTYEKMYTTYTCIFKRIGLNFRAIKADTGNTGGNVSHEFHALANSGEDLIAFSDSSNYAANVECAKALPPIGKCMTSIQTMKIIYEPKQHTVKEVNGFFNLPQDQHLKAILVEGSKRGSIIALVLRGDHNLNRLKAERHPLVAKPLTFATPKQVRATCGTNIGDIDSVCLDIPVIADYSAAYVANCVSNSNRDGQHITVLNQERNLCEVETGDLRNVIEGDPSPDGEGKLEIARGIEIGHLFQLGDRYSKKLNANVMDEYGRSKSLTMGCYGIGISRVVAATIEQNNDERGIIWPKSIAPFEVALIPVNSKKSIRVRKAADQIYQKLTEANVDVLYDDRNLRPGVSLSDMELIGIPHHLILGERALDKNIIEYKCRANGNSDIFPIKDVINMISNIMAT